MKAGICLSMERIPLLAEGVADYVELSLMQIASSTKEQLEAARRALSSLGIKATNSNGFCPKEIKLCGEGYDTAALREYSRRSLYLAAEYFDIKTFVIGSGNSRFAPEGDMERAKAQLMESYGVIADVAKEFGVVMAVEHLNSRETNTLVTAKESAEFVRKLAHPNMQLMIDYFHFSYEKEDISLIAENGDIIKHVHIANPYTRFTPAASDGYDYGILKNALDNIGYKGGVSIEAIYAEDFAKDANTALPFVKKIFCEGE